MRKFRVLLINLNSIKGLDIDPIYPIGTVYAGTILKQLGASVEIIDFIKSPEQYAELDFVNQDIDCLAFSLRNWDSTEINCLYLEPLYSEYIKRVVQQARNRNRQLLTIIGGAGFTVFADGIKELLFDIDYGISKNIEDSLYELLQEHITTNRLDVSPLQRICDLSFPIDHDSELIAAYIRWGSFQFGVPTKIGGKCSEKCIYCSYSIIDNGRLVNRRDQVIREDINILYHNGVREIFFTDSVFNGSSRHAKRICQLLIDMDLPGLEWSAYIIPTKDIEFLELAKRSGCKSLVVSFDSFSPVMLERLYKRFTVDTITEFIAGCRKYKLPFLAILLFGGPGENEETVRESCVYANQHLQLGELFFSFGIRILPGSKLAELSKLQYTDMMKPIFLDFPEQVFEYATKYFEGHFLRFSVLARVSMWRRAYRDMERVLSTNSEMSFLLRPELQIKADEREGNTDESGDRINYLIR